PRSPARQLRYFLFGATTCRLAFHRGGRREHRPLHLGEARVAARPAPSDQSVARHPGTASVLLVGLTGGIGSGKTTVARMLAERGAVVLDADRFAREAVAPGSPGLVRVLDEF